ncbi:MAG: biotin/lipoyl-containing protein, partial [Acidimicrobiia bacterium]|nr:biotin/lipoyl-containing protein [Acidimicrobiia bacterium]
MAYEFRLPDIGEGLVEAEIVEWLVAVGDTVERDQVVVHVETDKAVVEVPIPVAGTVLFLGGEAGEVLEVGSILVVVGEPDEQWPGQATDAEPEGEGDEAGESVSSEAAPIVGTLDSEATVLSRDDGPAAASASAPKALPLVRKLARDLGVDLDQIEGTGPDGRITRDDVTAAAEAQRKPRVRENGPGGDESGAPRSPTRPCAAVRSPSPDSPWHRAAPARARSGRPTRRRGCRCSPSGTAPRSSAGT